MIDIRCNACKRLAFKASENATGTFETRCQRSSCGRIITVTLPLPECSKQRCGHDEALGHRQYSDARGLPVTCEHDCHTRYSPAK